MDVPRINQVHEFTGLFPGDYFIHEFALKEGSVFAVRAFLRSISVDGKYYSIISPEFEPREPGLLRTFGELHSVLGRISHRAYELARLRGWPDSPAGVASIVAFSAGKKVKLSILERCRLFFI